MKPITIRDFERARSLSGLKASPDGKAAVFCVKQPEIERNRYRADLWAFDPQIQQARPLTQGGEESFFLWNGPDTVLFSAVREKEDQDKLDQGEELTVFYEISLRGGEARRAFALPVNVQDMEHLGGSRYLVSWLFDTKRPKLDGLKPEKREQVLKEIAEERDVHVCDEIPFWFNGRGFVNGKRTRLSVYDAKTGKLTHISEPTADVGCYALSPDKKRVAAAVQWVKTYRIVEQGLCLYDLAGGEAQRLLGQEGLSVDELAWQEGRLLVAAQVYGQGFPTDSAKVYTYSFEAHKLELLLDLDRELGGGLNTDCRLGGGTTFDVLNGDFYYLTCDENASVLNVLAKDGSPAREVSRRELAVDSFAMIDGLLYAIGFVGNSLQELYRVDVDTGAFIAVTGLNAKAFSGYYVATPRPLSFVNPDGVRIDGWVLEPMDYDPGKKYPGILEVHGGPRGSYGTCFFHAMQCIASHGCFVFFCNPRGSSGRGNAFADLNKKWGTVDYDDVMAFTDEVLKQYPAIDPKRLGVTGGSYGGFMTNWVIGHTDRFAAAVSCRSIANWAGFYGVSDLGGWFDENEQGGKPWDGVEKLWEHSPLQYIQGCTTPTLFIHSYEDYRCPLPEAQQMYYALVDQGVDARMCLFKGENHELSRSGQPKHRLRRLKEIESWFVRYLGQEEAEQ